MIINSNLSIFTLQQRCLKYGSKFLLLAKFKIALYTLFCVFSKNCINDRKCEGVGVEGDFLEQSGFCIRGLHATVPRGPNVWRCTGDEKDVFWWRTHTRCIDEPLSNLRGSITDASTLNRKPISYEI